MKRALSLCAAVALVGCAQDAGALNYCSVDTHELNLTVNGPPGVVTLTVFLEEKDWGEVLISLNPPEAVVAEGPDRLSEVRVADGGDFELEVLVYCLEAEDFEAQIDVTWLAPHGYQGQDGITFEEKSTHVVAVKCGPEEAVIPGLTDTEDHCSVIDELYRQYFTVPIPWNNRITGPTGNVFVGSDGVSEVISSGHLDITCQGSAGSVAEADMTADGWFCGPGKDGNSLVVCHPNTEPFTFDWFYYNGDYPLDLMVVAIAVDANIPFNDDMSYYQYGFVFDTDGYPNNDWMPYPAFPDDFFGGTDLWFQLLYTPWAGWTVDVADILPGNVISPRPSSNARFVIDGNTILLMVPMSEMGPGPWGLRTSTFRHQGNFLDDNWNGDALPFVSDGLTPIP